MLPGQWRGAVCPREPTAVGIPEFDDMATAQNVMVERLSVVLVHERQFGADAAHQLRNPLAGLQLGLETAVHDTATDPRVALEEALEKSGQLQQTIEQVLALSRLAPQHTGRVGTIEQLLNELPQRWHSALAERGRRLESVVEPDAAGFQVSLNACRQILDILVDNALLHGRGTVRIAAGRNVFDRGVSRANRPGIGLDLARNLAEAQGGRLTLGEQCPHHLQPADPDTNAH